MSLRGEEREQLLRLAREAVAAALEGREPETRPLAVALKRRAGAFVTLTRSRDGELRGCIGYLEALRPLADAVVDAARLAATEDSRFDPITPSELPGLRIEISVLGPLAPTRPDQLVLGEHGLVVRQGQRSGLLLPQVPLEHGWDREGFLDNTCRKAGLAPGAWRLPETELLSFTAEVFSETR